MMTAILLVAVLGLVWLAVMWVKSWPPYEPVDPGPWEGGLIVDGPQCPMRSRSTGRRCAFRAGHRPLRDGVEHDQPFARRPA